jgi:hypothetical protein
MEELVNSQLYMDLVRSKYNSNGQEIKQVGNNFKYPILKKTQK